MPHPRQPDFLRRHHRTDRRVRDLETGVHMLRADVSWHDSIPPTVFAKASGGSSHLERDTQEAGWPRYQKRSGIGSLIGSIIINDPAAMTGFSLWGTLPARMRPTHTYQALIAANHAPYFTLARVETDGDVLIHPGQLETPSSVTVTLDGLAWPVA